MAAADTAAPEDSAEVPDLPAYDQQILAVEEAKGWAWSSGRIVAMLMDKAGPFGVSERTAWRRLAQVEAAWAKVTDDAKAVHKARLRAHTEAAIKAGFEHGQIAAVVSAIKLQADLYGLNEPFQHEDVGKSAFDSSKLSTEELREFVRLGAKARPGQ